MIVESPSLFGLNWSAIIYDVRRISFSIDETSSTRSRRRVNVDVRRRRMSSG